MRKVPKSFQATIVTLVVGMLLPKLIDFTGIIIIDKILTKGLLSIAFNLATFVVGLGYFFGLLKGKKEGGKARIGIYLLFVVLILCFSSAIAVFFGFVGKIVAGILVLVTLLLIISFIIKVSSVCVLKLKMNLNIHKLIVYKKSKKILLSQMFKRWNLSLGKVIIKKLRVNLLLNLKR